METTPPAQSQLVREGTLERYPLPRLFFYLLKKSFLGWLTLVHETQGEATVYFREGFPCFTNFVSTEDYLGFLLLQRGIISPQQFSTSLQTLAEGNRLHGQILTEMGAINQAQLISGLNLQLKRKLNRLFSFEGASFALSAGEHAYGAGEEGQAIRADPLAVIYQGVRNTRSREQLEADLGRIRGSYLRLDPNVHTVTQRYGLGDDEQRLIALLAAGDCRLEDAIAHGALSETETSMVIYTLWITEQLLPVALEQYRPNVLINPRKAAQEPIASQSAASATKPTAAAADMRAARPAPTSSQPPTTARARPSGPQDPVALRNELLRRHQESQTGNLFAVLGLDRTATADAIRSAYLSLAKRFHPDRVASLGFRDLNAVAGELFRAIGEAHSTLVDPERRKEYEHRLGQGALNDGADEAMRAMKAEQAYQEGQLMFRRRRFVEALNHFSEAARLNTNEGEYIAWCAWARFHIPDDDRPALLKKLKQQLNDAIAISPNNSVPHQILGEISLALGDDGKAISAFNKALELNPRNTDAQRQLRLLKSREQRPQPAKGLFSRKK